MSIRFYTPDLHPAQTEFLLSGAEVHHLAVVCRAQVGQNIQLFDGRGRRADATVLQITRREVLLRLGAVVSSPAIQTSISLTLACPLPKGERSQFLVEKCTELDVEQFVPLRTHRSIRDPSEGKLARYQRIVIEACKQCGRDSLMAITPTMDITQFLTDHGPGWILHPQGIHLTEISLAPSSRKLAAAIGPEGGWEESELRAALDLGWTLVKFPTHILRVETAAIALAAWACLRDETHVSLS